MYKSALPGTEHAEKGLRRIILRIISESCLGHAIYCHALMLSRVGFRFSFLPASKLFLRHQTKVRANPFLFDIEIFTLKTCYKPRKNTKMH